MTTNLVLDTDIGSDVDDLLALATIFGSPTVVLRGVTTVYGDTVLRARIVAHACRLAGVVVRPIVAGLAQPRSGADVWWAGHEGRLIPDLEAEQVDAEPSALQVLAISPIVAAVGPLTNLAAALDQPGCQITDVFVMGGNFAGAEIEHNFRSDADAAAAVFSSGVRTTAVGLNQTTRIRVDASVAAELEACGAFGRLLAAELRQYWDASGSSSNVPHDAIAIVMLTDPEVFTFESGRVSITADGKEAGTSRFTSDGSGRHRIVTDLNEVRVAELIRARLLAAARAAG